MEKTVDIAHIIDFTELLHTNYLYNYYHHRIKTGNTLAFSFDPNIPSFKNHTTKKGLGKILKFISENPGLKTSEIRKALNLKSLFAETFTTLHYSELTYSDKGRQYITETGRQYLARLS